MSDMQETSLEGRRKNRYQSSIGKLLFAYILFVLAVMEGGYFVFQNYRENMKAEKLEDLSGIAELKVRQITSWMDERRWDAEAVQSDTFLVDAIDRWQQNGTPDGAVKVQLAARLTSLQQANEAYGYRSVFLYDKNGRLKLASSVDASRPAPDEIQALNRSSRDGQVNFSELYRVVEAQGARIRIDLKVPLRLRDKGAERDVGMLLFRIDPEHFLFPLIQHWPTPSASAESLLVRREKDEVIFLNRLRHIENSPLQMRFPLRSGLPAAMAVQGREGVAEGVDYRGARVVSVLSRVDGTSWYMVSKINEDEIYAPINRLADWILMLMSVLVAAGAAIGLFWWRKEKMASEHRQAHQKLSSRLRFLSKYANDIILLLDGQGRVIDFNDRALEAFGYTSDMFAGLTLDDLRAIDQSLTPAERFGQIEQAGGALVFESMFVRKNGEVFPIEASVRQIDIDGEKFYQGIMRDITERKKVEGELIRQKRFVRQIIDSDPNLIFVKDAAGRFLLANEAMARGYGQTVESIVGKRAEDLLNNPEQLALFEQAHQQVILSRCELISFDNGLMLAGERRWFKTIRKPLEQEEGEIDVLSIAMDITELKEAEERLQNEHVRLRTLVQTIPDMVWLKSVEGVYMLCNTQFERYFGAQEKDILGKTDYDFVDAELADFFRDKDRMAMAAGNAQINEEWITYPDNAQRALLETIKVPLRDEKGKIIGVMGIARDITGRKKAEARESWLRRILDNTLDMIFIFRPDTLRFVYVNQGGVECIGYSQDELLQMTPMDIKPLLSADEFRALLNPLMTGEKKVLRFETVYRCRGGAELPVEIQLQRVQEEDGQDVFVSVVRDIQDRREAEIRLQKQKLFMWQVIDADPNHIFVKDISGVFLLVNKSLAAAYGLDPREIVGRNISEINKFPDEVKVYQEADTEVITSGGEIVRVEPFSLPDHEKLWFLTVKKRLTMPDGSLSVLGIAVDITKQKRSEMKLANSYRKLQQLSLHLESARADERAKIALNLHDEMGATLVAIKMAVAWLSSRLPQGMPVLAEEVVHINELLADGILTLHQIVTQLRPNLLGDVGLTAAIRDYAKKFSQHTSIACVLSLPDEELQLNADQGITLFRILQETLNNVLKHAQASRVEIHLKLRGGALLMIIKDNGVGFDAAISKERSFGLLGIRERALMVGGRARIRSTPGKGVRVTINIPLQTQDKVS